jgi:hypothetical protein
MKNQPPPALFPENAGGFCLVAEVTTDGARIIREREEKAIAIREQAKNQKEMLFLVNQ